ncbi:MAG TPA: hypothetical protein PLF40_18450 [Kofleriaceae bacterium]|jgi:hypothetical protein|nr:hypothetical protein [Kofleriaceae bacterium]
MKTKTKLTTRRRVRAPRMLRRSRIDDATIEDGAPRLVFDRVTGPFAGPERSTDLSSASHHRGERH